MQQVHGNRSVRECLHTQITWLNYHKRFLQACKYHGLSLGKAISIRSVVALTLGTTVNVSEGASVSPSLFTRHSATHME